MMKTTWLFLFYILYYIILYVTFSYEMDRLLLLFRQLNDIIVLTTETFRKANRRFSTCSSKNINFIEVPVDNALF